MHVLRDLVVVTQPSQPVMPAVAVMRIGWATKSMPAKPYQHVVIDDKTVPVPHSVPYSLHLCMFLIDFSGHNLHMQSNMHKDVAC